MGFSINAHILLISNGFDWVSANLSIIYGKTAMWDQQKNLGNPIIPFPLETKISFYRSQPYGLSAINLKKSSEPDFFPVESISCNCLIFNIMYGKTVVVNQQNLVGNPIIPFPLETKISFYRSQPYGLTAINLKKVL
jgi:hypothetical protein